MTPVRVGIVGAGWRAEFFQRMARAFGAQGGDLELVGAAVRRPEHAEEVSRHWRVPCWTSPDDLLRHARPDLVVTSLPWPVNPEVIRTLVAAGVKVLSETPPAPTREALAALWADVGARQAVQVAEQYPRLPGHAARLAVVRDGIIGEPTSVQVSSTHTYHAIALIRSFLGIADDCGPVAVTTSVFHAGLVDPLTRAGWTHDDQPHDARTVIATLDFGNRRSGVYDFTDNQWHNRLRHRRIVIRASHGEIVDDSVVRHVDTETIVMSPIVRQQLGYDLNLDGYDTELLAYAGRPVWRNPFLGHRLMDEEIAIGSVLLDAARWAAGDGPEPYPLRRACEDHLIGLAIDESIAKRTPVTTEPAPWWP